MVDSPQNAGQNGREAEKGSLLRISMGSINRIEEESRGMPQPSSIGLVMSDHMKAEYLEDKNKFEQAS